MRATILFVHGTGVRAAGYTATLDTVERQVVRHRLDVDVRGCYWGEAEGATKRDARRARGSRDRLSY